MPITRDEIIETLDALAAPLGAQTSQEERLERQDRWVNEGGVELLEALLAVVASPPSEGQLRYANFDDWNTLLVEVAGALGKRNPEVALQRLSLVLEDDQARATAVDILGSVGDIRAVPRLAQLIQGRRLDEDDLVHVAGALGEIGGGDACRVLAQLRRTLKPDQEELKQEIDIAEQLARCA